jgi:anti-sigma B factor antagonist
MEIRERHVGPTVVLDLSGHLVGDSLLKDKVNSLVFQGRRQILLNLADVSYVDSSGLGELIAAHTAVARPGGQIKLLNLTKRVHDLLAITKLVTIFESYDLEAEALKSFPLTV